MNERHSTDRKTRPASRVRSFFIAVVIAGALTACDDRTTRPSPPVNPPPPPPASPALTRLEVSGPASVAPGEAAQFTATGTYSDGSTRNLSTEVGTVWRTSNTRVLPISSSGVATGGDRGEASISVTVSGRTASKGAVLVLPPGTFRLSGTITDTGVPLSGARVEVTHGPATGQVTTASPAYRIYGVAGDTEIRIQKSGYRDERRRLQVTDHVTADIEMTPSVARENVEGIYTLTVSGTGCTGVPEDARVRTFTATLRQQGPRVTVTLEGSNFLASGSRTHNSFSGTFEGDQLSFFMQGPFSYYYFYSYFYMPEVMEVLAPNSYYFMSGSATTRASANGRSGTLSGDIGTMEGPPRPRLLSSCRSTAHRFELVRR